MGGSRQVKYGHDAMGACNLELSKSELEDACRDQGTEDGVVKTLYTTGNTPLFNATGFLVGVFGDSDPTKRAAWVELVQDGIVEEAAWSDNGLCDGLVTGLSVTIYTAAVGNELEAQNKIVGAYYSYITTPVRFERALPELRQAVELRTVVTFVELPDRIMVEQVLATPRIVPGLPADFFYPFTLSTSGTTPNAGMPLLTVLAASL